MATCDSPNEKSRLAFGAKNAEAHALTPPWTTLIPRDLPYVEEKITYSVGMIRNGPIEEEMIEQGIPLKGLNDNRTLYDTLMTLDGEIPLVYTASDKPQFFLLDFGKC